MSLRDFFAYGVAKRSDLQQASQDAPLPVGARMARVPLSKISVTTTGYGTSTANESVGSYPNPDGSGYALKLQAVAEAVTTSGTGIIAEFTVHGGDFGIAFYSAPGGPMFDVTIDGVSYGVNSAVTKHGVAGPSFEDHQAVAMFTNLGGGDHFVRLSMAAAGAGGANRDLYVYGILGHEREGYQAPSRAAFYINPAAVPTTAGAIGYGSGFRYEIRILEKILYTNTNASARTVQVFSGGTQIGEVVLAAAGAAGSTASLDLGALGPRFATLTHIASGAGVNATVIGRPF